MYYVCKYDEWDARHPVTGRGHLVVKALEGLQGMRVEEDQLRFALDVYAQEFEGNSWGAFVEARPDMIQGKRIRMDKREIARMQDEAIGTIKEVLRPITDAVQADVMSTIGALEQNWGIEGLGYGVSELAKKRVIAGMFKMAKDDKTCGCGHHERAHRPEPGGDPSERRCRLCSSHNSKVCNNFHPAGRPGRW